MAPCFIKVTRAEGDEILINVADIAHLEPHLERGYENSLRQTFISLHNGIYRDLRTPLEDVLSLMRKAGGS